MWREWQIPWWQLLLFSHPMLSKLLQDHCSLHIKAISDHAVCVTDFSNQIEWRCSLRTSQSPGQSSQSKAASLKYGLWSIPPVVEIMASTWAEDVNASRENHSLSPFTTEEAETGCLTFIHQWLGPESLLDLLLPFSGHHQVLCAWQPNLHA